jgi:hypothetical protein
MKNPRNAEATTERDEQRPKPCPVCCDLSERRPFAPKTCKGCNKSWEREHLEAPSVRVSNAGFCA